MSQCANKPVTRGHLRNPRLALYLQQLRQMHLDGYDVALMTEIALDGLPAQSRPDAERAILRDLYRQLS